MTGVYRFLGTHRRSIGSGVPGEAIHQAAVDLAVWTKYPSAEAVKAAVDAGMRVAT